MCSSDLWMPMENLERCVISENCAKEVSQNGKLKTSLFVFVSKGI